jgi:hypothetical protein
MKAMTRNASHCTDATALAFAQNSHSAPQLAYIRSGLALNCEEKRRRTASWNQARRLRARTH